MTEITSGKLEQNVGQRIRFFREREGLTLQELASRSGLSMNTISRIERGRTSPMLSSMHRLAEALNVPITDFFDEAIPSPTVHLKAGQRREEHINGRTLEILGTGFAEPVIEPFRVTLEAGVVSSAGPITHPGEEFVYCLEGTLEFEILGEVYRLEKEDSLLFKCDQPHCWRNPSDEPTEFLVVFFGSEGQSLARGKHL